ncbi:MAG: hypothetical protein RLZZ567_669, partial [Actinomycetota bacterium]
LQLAPGVILVAEYELLVKSAKKSVEIRVILKAFFKARFSNTLFFICQS